ncbi:hypothetical protein LshimejAT787_0905040 [Lyophyllum shimeji]|uniref:Uncharacterized protein n=1 Tax=Lyophyllum shimeji TaxID=47721 RepID=A0A9P3UN67_LYOSH|nr:hypothetical protein LshimejAT787_0905040 [Lyophyllum shimeji]
MFPHGRRVDQMEDDGHEMYREILEFTRHGIYPAAVRKEALELVMIQVEIRETHQLMRALDEEFDYEDLQTFLFQILEYDTQANQAAMSPTFSSQVARFDATSIPLAFFIFRLSLSRRKSHRVAVDSFLLAMCAKKSSLADHLLRIFKFGQDSDYLDSLQEYQPEERQTLWKVLAVLRQGEFPYLEERLRSRTVRIDEILREPQPSTDHISTACFDLVEFSRDGLGHLVKGVRAWAFSRIFAFLARGSELWEVLISTLGRVPHGDQYRVLSRILYCTVPALNLSPGPSDRELLDAYHHAFGFPQTNLDLPQEQDVYIVSQFFRFIVLAFARQSSLRAAMMLDEHFLSIIILCLAPPEAPLTSADLSRLIASNPLTR